jgi:hypothetical protein
MRHSIDNIEEDDAPYLEYTSNLRNINNNSGVLKDNQSGRNGTQDCFRNNSFIS